MARDAQKQAKDTYGRSVDTFNTGKTRTDQGYNALFPAYQSEATNPQGFAPQDLATMKTGVEESTGGAVAGASGEGYLRAARNRNAGGFSKALDGSVRDAMDVNSSKGLDIDTENAKLKEMNRQSGLEGMNRLYNTNNQDELSAIGLQDQSTNALTTAGNSGWFQNFLGLMNASANVAKGVSGFQLPSR